MPPEDAPPPAATPVVVPPADQPKSERIKTFADRFETKLAEMGGDDDAEETETETETPAVPAPDKKPVAAAEKKPAAPEDVPVKPSERAAFREEMREKRAKFEKERTDFEKQRGEQTTTHVERISKADSILKAIEDGDPEGFAKAVGTKDFNEFQESFIKRLADPNYKEVQELKRWKADEEKRKEQEKQEGERRTAEQKKAELRTGFIADLKDKSSKSSDKLAQVMGDDPLFLNAVYRIIGDHYDSDGLISVESALDRGVKGSPSTLREEMKGLHEKLQRVFGEPPALAEANGRKKIAPKTAVAPAKTTDASGGNGKWDGPNDPRWREHFRRRMAEVKDD